MNGLKESVQASAASAPASIGNLAVGFDLIGLAIDGPRDEVHLSRGSQPGLTVASIEGVCTDLPTDPEQNTAAVAIRRVLEVSGVPDEAVSLDISLLKGIPLASGMGGSAASAVAAALAINQWLREPLDQQSLYRCALDGETVASGSRHGDNVAPALFGGLCLAIPDLSHRQAGMAGDPPGADEVMSWPMPDGLWLTLVHPELQILTVDARSVLSNSVPLRDALDQQAFLAQFLIACQQGQSERAGRALQDLIIEPQRARLIPGFELVKRSALEAGAIACSISGAGPSMFACSLHSDQAAAIGKAMQSEFASLAIDSQCWQSPGYAAGAMIVTEAVI